MLMTPKLVARSWNVTSVIRNPDQKPEILEAGKNGPGKIEVLIESLEDVKSDGDAKRILDLVKPDWVIWSAGPSHAPHKSKNDMLLMKIQELEVKVVLLALTLLIAMLAFISSAPRSVTHQSKSFCSSQRLLLDKVAPHGSTMSLTI